MRPTEDELIIEEHYRHLVRKSPFWKNKLFVYANGDENDGRPLIKGVPQTWLTMFLYGEDERFRLGFNLGFQAAKEWYGK